MAKKKSTYVQDESELQDMLTFYGKTYQEVYFIRCLNNNHFIAVECAPAKSGLATVERSTGMRNVFGYQDMFMTTRRRADKNSMGQRMIGFECACGNDTRLSNHELGIVQERRVVMTKGGSVVHADPPIRSLSPFERAQMEAQVSIKQAQSNLPADYQTYTDPQGHFIERFESFEIVRMK